jgi:predicted DNA-binding antitoxin AbrB/MazE fold protein
MSHTIPAIFESGVFRPLAPVPLEPGTRVEIALPQMAGREPANYTLADRQAFLDRMDSMPDDSPNDGFSNRDHDRLIYGV